MTSESYLVRRAIYQRLHIEEMANRKTEISMGIQVEEIGDSSAIVGSYVPSGK